MLNRYLVLETSPEAFESGSSCCNCCSKSAENIMPKWHRQGKTGLLQNMVKEKDVDERGRGGRGGERRGRSRQEGEFKDMVKLPRKEIEAQRKKSL